MKIPRFAYKLFISTFVVLMMVCTSPVNASEISEEIDFDRVQESACDELYIASNTDVEDQTIANIRTDFKTIASIGRSAGFTTAATFLEHSLQDAPSALVYTSSSSYAKQLLKSSECNDIVEAFKELVTGQSLTRKNISGSVALNSTTDLFLAYNKVSYLVKGVNNSGTWTLTIIFTDTYDFDYVKWNSNMSGYSTAVTILNNYGARAEELGAIVPYKIGVTVSTAFTEYQLTNIENLETE